MVRSAGLTSELGTEVGGIVAHFASHRLKRGASLEVRGDGPYMRGRRHGIGCRETIPVNIIDIYEETIPIEEAGVVTHNHRVSDKEGK